MDDRENSRYWEENAAEWARLVHPCFARPPFDWVTDAAGQKRASAVAEPQAAAADVAAHPRLQCAAAVPWFLQLRLRKP